MSTSLRRLAPIIVLAIAVAACSGASSPTPGTSTPPAPPASVAALPTPQASATPAAATPAAPEASAIPAAGTPAAICTDAAAFRASVAAITNLKLAQVGVSGVTAALTDVQASAQALLVSGKDLVAQSVATLLADVQALQTTLTGLGNQPSLGAKATAVKAAIDQIKTAAADVQTALGTTCPAQ